MLWKKLRQVDHAVLYFIGKFADIVVLSLLWLVCSIPLVTVVPASAALYYAAVKSIRCDCDKVTAAFFHAFRENLRQGAALSVLVLAITVIGAVNLLMVEWMPQGSPARAFFAVFLRLILLLLLAFYLYLGPVLSRFSKSMGGLIRFTLVIMLKHLGTTVALSCMAVVCIIAVWFYSISVVLLPSVLALCGSLLIERVFKQYMEPPMEDLPPDQFPWYWQV